MFYIRSKTKHGKSNDISKFHTKISFSNEENYNPNYSWQYWRLSLTVRLTSHRLITEM